MTAVVARAEFTVDRANDFLKVDELTKLTGMSRGEFVQVVVKELMDNALDAAEMTDTDPDITVYVAFTDDDESLTISVTDNGPGFPAASVGKILDFSSRTSSKAKFRTPTRGFQGNALMTVIGIAAVTGGHPVIIESEGTRHTLAAELVGERVRKIHDPVPGAAQRGTTVTVTLDTVLLNAAPTGGAWDVVKAYAFANPHATIRLTGEDPSTWERTGPCKKYRPGKFGSVHWYTLAEFTDLALSYAELCDVPLGAFIAQFERLTGTAHAKAIRQTARVPSFEALRYYPEDTPALFDAMRCRAAAPAPTSLGPIGKHHLEQRMAGVPGTFRYKSIGVVDDVGIPWFMEAAVLLR